MSLSRSWVRGLFGPRHDNREHPCPFLCPAACRSPLHPSSNESCRNGSLGSPAKTATTIRKSTLKIPTPLGTFAPPAEESAGESRGRPAGCRYRGGIRGAPAAVNPFPDSFYSGGLSLWNYRIIRATKNRIKCPRQKSSVLIHSMEFARVTPSLPRGGSSPRGYGPCHPHHCHFHWECPRGDPLLPEAPGAADP